MRIELSKKGSILTQTKQDIKTVPTRKKGGIAYIENPFWEPTDIEIGKKHINVGGGVHVDQKTGESVSHSGIHIVKEIDREEHIKVYTKNIKPIFELKPTTQKVLQFLIVELQKTPNADSIYLAWFTANEYFSEENINVSRSSFQRALKELLEKGFIAESLKPNMFWFNPHLFFNGDRMVFIKEYRIKEKNEIKETTENTDKEFLEKPQQQEIGGLE